MTSLGTSTDEQISQLIGTTIEQLDITEKAFAATESCYLDLGDRLADAGAEVYVQGSFMLGTVVRPHHGAGEYDLDLVCRLDVIKTSITQKDLKERIGGLLANYLSDHDGEGCETPAELTEGRRAWCLHYEHFHMDVLPAIPDAEAGSVTAIELTDQNLRLWQKSDPLAYVEWFRGQCATQFQKELVILASGGFVDAVPRHRVRTPLHRVVQVLKRHRDIHFVDDLDDRPPSSLITTLAGLSYDGEENLVSATMKALQRMPAHIEKRNGQYWVENPACPGENFADKWNEYEKRRLKFEAWRAAVEEDLASLLVETKGATALHQRLAKAFGASPVEEAVKVLGTRATATPEVSSRSLTIGGPSGAAATARGASASFRDTEEFIENVYPVILRYEVRVDCKVTQDGFRPTRLRKMLSDRVPLKARKALEFMIEECDVPEPYMVRWKVLNRGLEAERRDKIRGQIVNPSNGTSRREVTSFRGDHLVECYIVKDGVVVARDRILVPIEPS